MEKFEEILKKIENKKKQWDACQPLPKALQKNLNHWYKVELTYTSNAIEGNTLTAQETALIIEKGITVEGKTLREHLEARNHAEAFEWISDGVQKHTRKIGINDILEIHRLILKDIDTPNAGKFRNVPIRVAGSRSIFPNPLKVSKLMEEFVVWLNESKDSPVELAVKAHLKLVSIHPFTDGNGRTARLLMNFVMIRNGYPPVIIGKNDRRSYISSLEKAQHLKKEDDYYKLLFSLVDNALDISLEAVKPSKHTDKQNKIPTNLLKIGELAKACGESVPTIRYWTKEGLLKPEERTKGGYFLYSQEAVKFVAKIRQLQKKKRLTIDEIKRTML